MFDVRSDNAAAQQALADCRFSLLGGEGASGMSTRYSTLGVLAPGRATRTISLARFQQLLATPKQSTKRQPSKKVFLKASASCAAAGIGLESAPIQVKTSKRSGSLIAKRWLARLASQLRS
jgi:hypothetical protein